MDFLDNIYNIDVIGELTEKEGFFSFESTGVSTVVKIVTVQKLVEGKSFYNLAFGNLVHEGEEVYIDDKALNQNKDGNKVLNTVFACLLLYLDQYPTSQIVFFGNTEVKNNLYKRKISTRLSELGKYFNVLGGMVNIELENETYDETIKYGNGKSRKKSVRNKVIDQGQAISTLNNNNFQTVVFNPENIDMYKFVMLRLKE